MQVTLRLWPTSVLGHQHWLAMGLLDAFPGDQVPHEDLPHAAAGEQHAGVGAEGHRVDGVGGRDKAGQACRGGLDTSATALAKQYLRNIPEHDLVRLSPNNQGFAIRRDAAGADVVVLTS